MDQHLQFIGLAPDAPWRVARAAWLAGALLSLACSHDLGPDNPEPDPARPRVVSVALGGVTETRVDATDSEAWIYFDFETGGEVAVTDPLTSPAWDVAFSRFKIKSNGGVSGGAGTMVAPVDGVELSGVSSAPTTGWQTDRPDGDDMNTDVDTPFNGPDNWFDYDPVTHVLSPRARVYVVRTAESKAFALQIRGYYDAAGTGGYLVFQWKPVAP